ncbi:hypothetical protein Tco_0542160 [Tanacetum coccineum]
MVTNSPCLTDKKELAIPGQTATGKEFTNPLMAGSLPKTIISPTSCINMDPYEFSHVYLVISSVLVMNRGITHIYVLPIPSMLMANIDFFDKHNMVAFLQKLSGSEEFHQIVDFLTGSHIRYALTANSTIYVSLVEQFWQTATVETVNDGEQQITATVDGHKFAITKASVRRHL